MFTRFDIIDERDGHPPDRETDGRSDTAWLSQALQARQK